MTNEFMKQAIEFRVARGKELAKKYSKLKGLSWEEFLFALPEHLDFITDNETFEALNK